MGVHRLVATIGLLALSACASPTAPAEPEVALSQQAEDELLYACLVQAWINSGPHLTPHSLARYHHLASYCYARWT